MRKETLLLVILATILAGGLLFNFGPVLSATPTPVKVSELTPIATVTPDSLLYIVQDPDGTPVSRKASVEAAVRAGMEPISIVSDTVTVGGSLVVTNGANISGTLTADTWALPDHDHSGDAGDGGAFDATNLLSTGAYTNQVLAADGSGATQWITVSLATLSDHDHSGDAGDGGTFDAANLTSGSATDGYVLTADGVGGAAWEAAGSSSGYTQGCRVYNNTNITLSNGVEKALTFNSERYDTDNMHSTVSATNRITITTSGVYMIWGNVTFTNNAAGVRAAYIYLNGATIIARTQADAVANSSGSTIIQISSIYNLSAGSYLELRAEQNSGGDLAVQSNANYSPEFAVQRIG